MSERSSESLYRATEPPQGALSFAAVEARSRRGPTLWWGLSGVSIAAAVVLIATLALQPRHGVSSLERIVTFVDGSRVTLNGDTNLDIVETEPSRIEVALGIGSGYFDISKRPERDFSVIAGDAQVNVIGTRFTIVHPSDGPVTVSVEEGVVEVIRLGQRTELRRGDRWVEPVPTQAKAEPEKPAVESEEPTASTAAPPARKPRHAKRVRTPVPEPTPAESAFEQARSAARQGRHADAIAAYTAFIEGNLGHVRAPWASFQVGRIAMDHTDQPMLAIRALDRAIELAPTAPFVPDALARHITLLERFGDWQGCIAARQHYLDRYPRGAHVPEVSRACQR